MILRSVELENFRNLRTQSLALDERGAVLQAPNGRGKTNFLEGLHYLSLFRSFRGAPDAEVVRFGERAFRVRGETETGSGASRSVGVAVEGSRKRISVDGREGRPAEHVGEALSVVLSPGDIRLVQGSPQRRRQYLDVTLALSSKRYLKTLQEYRRALRQRNRVLQAGAGQGRDSALEPWTEHLALHGGAILLERGRFLARWSERFTEVSARLAGSPEGAVRWRYDSPLAAEVEEAAREHEARERGWAEGDYPTGRTVDSAAVGGAAVGGAGASGAAVDEGVLTVAASRGSAASAPSRASAPGVASGVAQGRTAGLADALRERFQRLAVAERRRGVTLAGPHRDDLSFHALLAAPDLWEAHRGAGAPDRAPLRAPVEETRVGRTGGYLKAEGHAGEELERDLRKFGSQGEQRTAALALRFVECQALTSERGELPVVLLDDVFSELDPSRSRELMGFLAPGQQVFLTTPKPLAIELPQDLPRYDIADGVVRRS